MYKTPLDDKKIANSGEDDIDIARLIQEMSNLGEFWPVPIRALQVKYELLKIQIAELTRQRDEAEKRGNFFENLRQYREAIARAEAAEMARDNAKAAFDGLAVLATNLERERDGFEKRADEAESHVPGCPYFEEYQRGDCRCDGESRIADLKRQVAAMRDVLVAAPHMPEGDRLTSFDRWCLDYDAWLQHRLAPSLSTHITA